MRYVSTRGAAPELGFEDVLLAGLARDGGLYVPRSWPRFSEGDLAALAGLDYADLAARVMTPFLGGAFGEDEFAAMVAESCATFRHRAVAPLTQLDQGLWLLELFHGPTLAFKDHALQLVGRLFDRVLHRRGQRVTVVGATSGDTGSAAIEACRDRDAIDIFILHPKGRVSEVQRRQMTTVDSANVHNIAIEGTFDDCQDLVKAMFGHTAFRDEMRLSAVNSINWARVMAQIPYFVAAAVALGAPARAVAFSVPTGNFGNVYAGYVARAMGLPISQLVVGTNVNDVLARFFDKGSMTMTEVRPTLSPSMDIQVSSNFERLLFDLLGRDGAKVADTMRRFREDGVLSLEAAPWQEARGLFDALRVDDEETLRTIAQTHADTGLLLDPHSAVALRAARGRRRDAAVPMVSLATAHPAKFPDAVEKATGLRPALPAHLSDLFERKERYRTLANDRGAVEDFIRAHVACEGAA